MSELVVVTFDDKFKADAALLALLKLEYAHLAHLEDAVVVVKNADGKVRVKAYHDLLEPVPELGNDLWGGIISAVVFHRTLEIAQGVFDPQFLTDVEDALPPNSSALFVLVPPPDLDSVKAELSTTGGSVYITSLSDADSTQLKQGLQVVHS